MWLSIFSLLSGVTREQYAFEEHIGQESETKSIWCIDEKYTSIDSERLKLFKKATSFHIRDTSITEIPDGVQELKNLETFVFTNNIKTAIKLKGLERLNNLPKLVTLNLTSNSFTELPSSIGELKNLCYLTIVNNKLKTLPPEIGNLTSLISLSLYKGDIKELPVEIGKLKKLETLELEANKLVDLPLQIRRLRSLVSLNLSKNKIEYLPEKIWNLKNLSSLNLYNNLLTDLPPGIGKAKNLEKLDLSSNKFKTLSSDIGNSLNLRYLDLRDNEVEELPKEMGKLKKLVNLCLRNNRLSYLPEEFKELAPIKLFGLDVDPMFGIMRYVNSFLRGGSLTTLNIDRNHFPTTTPLPTGLGIQAIKDMGIIKLIIGKQLRKNLTISAIIKDMEQQPVHWNMNTIRKIKARGNVVDEVADISDLTLRMMWNKVLKHFIYDNFDEPDHKPVEEPATKSAKELEIDRAINVIVNSQAFEQVKKANEQNIKESVIKFESTPQNKKISLRKRIDDLILKAIGAEGNENTTRNIELKSYLKDVFSIFLWNIKNSIENENSAQLADARTGLHSLCKDNLVNCITGQMEGLMYFHSIYSLGNKALDPRPLQDFILKFIASSKQNALIVSLSENNSENVHNISQMKAIFKDILGISDVFDDPHETLRIGEKGTALNAFFDLFSIDKIAPEILDSINEDPDLLKESLYFLNATMKRENRIEARKREKLLRSLIQKYGKQEDKRIIKLRSKRINYKYNDVIEKYFEYEEIPGFEELNPKKLLFDGLLRIFLEMEIVEYLVK